MWRSAGQIKGELYWTKCYKQLREFILLSSLVPDSFIILLGSESIVQQLISGFLLHFITSFIVKKKKKSKPQQIILNGVVLDSVYIKTYYHWKHIGQGSSCLLQKHFECKHSGCFSHCAFYLKGKIGFQNCSAFHFDLEICRNHRRRSDLPSS